MAEAPNEGSSEIENAITMAWAILVLVVVLIVIARMPCDFVLKRAPATWPNLVFIYAQAARAFHRAPVDTKTSAERKLCSTDSIALFVMLTMVARKDRQIRFRGMPAFRDVETPDHVWDLVNYVRLCRAIRKKVIQRSSEGLV